MAVKPIISTITPWDATVGSNITFSYSGNLPVTAKGIIRNASTLETLCTLTGNVVGGSGDTFMFFIPPDSFKADPLDTNANGYKYCIQLTVYDSQNHASAISDKAYFWCLATPECYYILPIDGSEIGNPFINLELSYHQDNGEKLYTYRHYLYDEGKNIVASSDTFYDDTGMTYSFKGLNNRTFYYVRTQGRTKNGMLVDTGYVKVLINYGEEETYSVLGLESDSNATVFGDTNLICIEADEDPAYYIFLNSYVQLIGKKVTYQTNYSIFRDFTIQLKITKLKYNGLILKMYNKDNPDCIITLDSYVFDDGLLRYCLKAFNGIATYVLYTPGIEVDHDDIMVINIRRIDNVFSLEALPAIE